MGQRISTPTMIELIEALRKQYKTSTRKEKGRILDQFVMVGGYHRKHAVRLLGRGDGESTKQKEEDWDVADLLESLQETSYASYVPLPHEAPQF